MLEIKNFKFDEFTNTNHLDLLDLNREKSVSYKDEIENLMEVAQCIRNIINVPMKITSGFRCEELNAVVTKNPQSNSDHKRGEAFDFIPLSGLKVENCFEMLKNNKTILEAFGVTKIIFENIGSSKWIHISAKGKSSNVVYMTTTDGKNYKVV